MATLEAPAPETPSWATRLTGGAPLGTWLRERGVYVALLVLVVYNVAATKNFVTLDTLQLLFSQLPPVIIVSLGMALVIGTGGVDLSVGATMAIASAVMAKFVIAPSEGGVGASIGVAIVAAILAGLLVGVFNGVVVAVARVQPIVATLGILVAGRGIALVITGGALVELFVPFFRTVRLGKVLGVPYVMVVAALLALLVSFLVRRTAFGYRLLAIGGNRRASVLAGLPVRRTLITVYAISGTLAAVAGVIATARLRASDPSFIGLLFELSAITAVVVGGTALTGGRVRILGTVAGAVLIQLLETTLVSHNAPDSVARIVEALIIIAAVYIQRTSRSSR
jgi:galactofuranose transport system permease protein